MVQKPYKFHKNILDKGKRGKGKRPGRGKGKGSGSDYGTGYGTSYITGYGYGTGYPSYVLNRLWVWH